MSKAPQVYEQFVDYATSSTTPGASRTGYQRVFLRRPGLPLPLLKFSGGSVTFYATFSTDTAMPSW
jgi:hypothetical protein